jgi:hypothetical protein
VLTHRPKARGGRQLAAYHPLTMATGDSLVRVETVILSFLISGLALGFVLSRLQRRRPDLLVGTPLAVAFGLRLLAIAGISSTGLESSLRGGDEKLFLYWAHGLADSPFGHGFYPHGQYPLHTVVFAIQLKLGGFSDGALRITQVGIALMGVLLLVAAVHDLAGARAARITAWVLAFEPASIFFNSILHKEPLMELAGGLMVFGASKMWRRLDLSGLVIMALAGFIAVKTRPYAGWFLISGGAVLVLHASLRRLDRPLRAMPLVYAVIIAGFVAAPAVIQVSSKKSLTELQASQNANTSNAGTVGNNLALEEVDYSTRGRVFANLPQRMLDVVVRPYPWQVANASQQLGAVGSLFALTVLVLLIGALWRRRGEVMALTGPVLYPMLFLLAAYALSAGNAGTSFRYRTHLVTLGVAMLVSLRVGMVTARASAPAPAEPPRIRDPGRPVALVQ